MRLLSVAVALLLLAPLDADAQTVQRFQVTPVSALLQPDRSTQQDSEPYPTYRREGGILGAIVIGLIAAFITYKICDSDQDFEEGERCTGETVGLGMAGAVVGYILGSKIGGTIEKSPAPSY